MTRLARFLVPLLCVALASGAAFAQATAGTVAARLDGAWTLVAADDLARALGATSSDDGRALTLRAPTGVLTAFDGDADALWLPTGGSEPAIVAAALPVVLAWALGAGATWFLLEPEGRLEVFGTLAAATAVAALVGMLVAAIGARGVARDVVQLRDEARRVAMGELTAPVTTRRDDELGEIAGSLERTRLSLQEGLERLRKRARS
ncbi:MAG: HAMP domain-containing protein [Trueperaceae bacterium]|nr:HAMP domain-containing protein [Trueperaceae bacterium]